MLISDDSIVIAVDSTLARGGGILILPKTKKIYFYSLDWSKLETITEIPISQLFNVAVALELFEEFVDQYRNIREDKHDQNEQTQSSLFLFSPNQLFSPEEDESDLTNVTPMNNCNKKYYTFFIELEQKLKSEPFRGKLKQMNIGDHSDSSSFSNSVMKICASLAKENCTFNSGIPSLRNDEKFSDYSVENVSDSVTAMLALVSATLLFPK